MSPKETIIKLAKKLDELSITDYSINHSSTDFGCSSYLYVSTLKIRASDHSTGNQRILSEVPLCDFNFNEVVFLIERFVFPERFEKTVFLDFGDVREIKKSKIETLPWEYKINKDVTRISKRGHEMSLIQCRNVEKTKYNRR